MDNYEKKYKEALERAIEWEKKYILTNTISPDGTMAKEFKEIFQELAESEDEKIRKAIVCGMNALKEQKKETFADIPINDCIVWLEKQKEPEDKGEISDGYHTFNELYYYRMLYNAAFFNLLPKELVHKSKKHHDGKECFGGGWFIVIANLPTGQISNHYELKDWDLFQIPEKEFADEWDGHTPQEVAERLYKFLQEKQKEQKPQGVYVDCTEHPEWYGMPPKEQKPVWSEEDLEHIKSIIHRTEVYGGNCLYGRAKEDLEWLKNLLNRFLIQPKPVGWSEDDEKMLNNVLFVLESYVSQSECASSPSLITTYPTYYKEIDWLKSLRPQYHGDVTMTEAYKMGLEAGKASSWKPSEEQMKALLNAEGLLRKDKFIAIASKLAELYEQLKKL